MGGALYYFQDRPDRWGTAAVFCLYFAPRSRILSGSLALVRSHSLRRRKMSCGSLQNIILYLPGGQSGGALATLGPIANTTIAAAAHAHVAGPQGVEGFVSIPSQGTTDTTLSQRIVTREEFERARAGMRVLVPPRTDQRGFADDGAQDVPPALRKLFDAFRERKVDEVHRAITRDTLASVPVCRIAPSYALLPCNVGSAAVGCAAAGPVVVGCLS